MSDAVGPSDRPHFLSPLHCWFVFFMQICLSIISNLRMLIIVGNFICRQRKWTYFKMIILFYLSPSFTCLKEGARKGHPAVPVLRTTLRFSLLTGRWKLTACGGSNRSSVLFRQQLWCSSGTEWVYNLQISIHYIFWNNIQITVTFIMI